jgi:hypothetical protein
LGRYTNGLTQVCTQTDRQTDRQTNDLKNLLLFFQNKESKLLNDIILYTAFLAEDEVIFLIQKVEEATEIYILKIYTKKYF